MTRKVGGIVQPTPWPRWAEAVWPYVRWGVPIASAAVIFGILMSCGCKSVTLFAYHQAGKPPMIIPADTEPPANRPAVVENAVPAGSSNSSNTPLPPDDSPWWQDPTTIAAILIAGAASFRELRKQWGNVKHLVKPVVKP
jgi:hypothetical protein